MIVYLISKIASAQLEISELEIKINEAEKELNSCKQLKQILARIISNSLNGCASLENAGNNLNKGIRIAGIGQGIKIFDRFVKIKELNSKATIGETSVDKRIKELELELEFSKLRIKTLNTNISNWKSEITRIERRVILESQNKVKE